MGSLTVSSEEGTEEGDTRITVSEGKTEGDVYKYKVGTNEVNVTYDMNVRSWSAWNGTDEITAETGRILTLVEATSGYKARKVGHVTVVAK